MHEGQQPEHRPAPQQPAQNICRQQEHLYLLQEPQPPALLFQGAADKLQREGDDEAEAEQGQEGDETCLIGKEGQQLGIRQDPDARIQHQPEHDADLIPDFRPEDPAHREQQQAKLCRTEGAERKKSSAYRLLCR